MYSNSRPKPKTTRDKKYLKWLESQRCVICGHPKEDGRDVVAAHQSTSGRGTAIKGSDHEALPLCTFCHYEEGQRGVKTVWRGIDRKQKIINHLSRYIQLLEIR